MLGFRLDEVDFDEKGCLSGQPFLVGILLNYLLKDEMALASSSFTSKTV